MPGQTPFRPRRSLMAAFAAASVVWCASTAPGSVVIAQSDLDEFMRRVVTRRDDNWKKLQQYILDENETMDVLGPGGVRVWGERREYTWYVRDGFFIRSPLKANGAAVGEADRRKYEADSLRREQRREQRAKAGAPDSREADDRAAANDEPSADRDRVLTEPDAPTTDLDGLIRQTRQPEFIRAAYFLRFKFDQGGVLRSRLLRQFRPTGTEGARCMRRTIAGGAYGVRRCRSVLHD